MPGPLLLHPFVRDLHRARQLGVDTRRVSIFASRRAGRERVCARGRPGLPGLHFPSCIARSSPSSIVRSLLSAFRVPSVLGRRLLFVRRSPATALARAEPSHVAEPTASALARVRGRL